MDIPDAPKKPATFRRFTTWNLAKKILKEGKLELRHPSRWEDKEDLSLFSEEWAGPEHENIKALCVNWHHERNHNWTSYGNDKRNLVCIFIKPELIEPSNPNLICRKINYFSNEETYKNKRKDYKYLYPDINTIKRIHYRDEREFRFLCKSEDPSTINFLEGSIEEVSFSPHMSSVNVERRKAHLEKLRKKRCWLKGATFRQSNILDKVPD
jgi:hypothetical protein